MSICYCKLYLRIKLEKTFSKLSERQLIMKLNQARKQLGIPLDSLVKSSNDPKDHMQWESPCLHHQKQGYRVATSFIKDITPQAVQLYSPKLKSLSHKQIFFMPAWLKQKEYKLPYGNPALCYTEEGIVIAVKQGLRFLGLLVGVSELRFITLPSPKVFSDPIECPKNEKYQLPAYAQELSCRKIPHCYQKKSALIRQVWNC